MSRPIAELMGVDDVGNLVCKLCDSILGEAEITKEEEKGLELSIKMHYQMVHNIELEVEPEL